MTLLFDYDDTLVQTQIVRIKALQYAGKYFYDLNISKKRILELWGLGFEQFIDQLFDNVDKTQIIIKNYKSILDKFPNKRYPKALSLINKALKNQKVGIISSFSTSLLKEELHKLNFPVNNFFIIQGSDQSQYHKPDPRVFNPVKKQIGNIGYNKSRVTYIGDSISDYEAAKGAGFGFIGIAGRTTEPSEFKKNSAPYVMNLTQLGKKLDLDKK